MVLSSSVSGRVGGARVSSAGFDSGVVCVAGGGAAAALVLVSVGEQQERSGGESHGVVSGDWCEWRQQRRGVCECCWCRAGWCDVSVGVRVGGAAAACLLGCLTAVLCARCCWRRWWERWCCCQCWSAARSLRWFSYDGASVSSAEGSNIASTGGMRVSVSGSGFGADDTCWRTVGGSVPCDE